MASKAKVKKETKNIIEHIPFSQNESKHVHFSDPLCETLKTKKFTEDEKTSSKFKKWAPPSRRHFSSDIPSRKELGKPTIHIIEENDKENTNLISNVRDSGAITEQTQITKRLEVTKKKQQQKKQATSQHQDPNILKSTSSEKSVQVHTIEGSKDLTPEETRELLTVADTMHSM